MPTEPEASARSRRGTQDRRSHRPAVRAASLYGLFGAIWVFASDRLVDLVLHDPRLRSTAQTIKGWAFVGVSAAFVFAFVAARRRAEQELLRARANLDEAERVGRVGSWALDGRSRRFTLSQGACLALRLPSGERPTVATIFDLVHPNDRGPAREWVEQALAGQAPAAMDLRIPRPGGPPRVVQIRAVPEVDGSGAVVRVIGAVQDVTERERLEERLRALRAIDREILSSRSADEVIRTALLQLLTLAAADRGSVARLDPDRDVFRVYHVEDDGSARLGPGIEIPSTAMGETLGALTRGEVVLTSDIRGRVRSVPALAVLAEQGFRSSVSAPIRVDGRLLGVLSVLARRVGAFDEELGAVVLEVADQLAVALVQADLREELARHAEELERRVAERTAELAERSVQLEAFSATVAHDLRAPLRAISGFGRALLQDATLPAEARRDAERIVAAAARLDDLIGDLLTYSRLSLRGIPRTPVRLDEAVQAALGQLADDVARRGAEIEVAGPLPSVLGHRSTLVVVIANLLGNAVKFVAPGTRPRVRVSAEVREGRVRLSVADNGIGIPPQERERIFEPLERLHGRERYPGTGIGLAIVRTGVERMGGRVGVEGRPGDGSTFWVELQAAADPADGDGEGGRRLQGWRMPETDGLVPDRVLLVDDDPDDRELIRRELTRAFPGVEIVEVTDERSLVAALATADLDVVITDYAMGWTDGLTVFRRIRGAMPHIPVVMFTGSGNEEVAVEGLKAGIEDYVLKGHLVRLPMAVSGAMARALQRLELQAAERALRESEERFRELAENAIDVISRYRVKEPRGFEYVSPSVTQVTGYTPEEHYADPDLRTRFVHPEDRHLLEVILRGEGPSSARMRWIRKDGGVIWTDSRMRVIRDEQGRPTVIECIMREVTDLVLAERDREEQARKLGRLAEERLRLARRLVRAQEEERQRVALEIHDGIGQILTSISLFASDLDQVVPEEHRERVVRVQELIQRAIAESRALVWSLRPPDLERLGLVPAIEHLAGNLRDRGEVEIHVLDETGGRRLPEDVETVAFRIVQEALNNAVKHAKASQISIIVEVRDGRLSVVVEDDGRGFDVGLVDRADPDLAGGFGLRGMRERAELVGGVLVIESTKGVGTTIRLEVPVG